MLWKFKSLSAVAAILLLIIGHPDQAQQPQPSGDPVLVGAGDIASCALDGDEQTALLIDKIPGTVFTAGDNAYPYGADDDFNKCYAHSWGRFKTRTRPAPGNHEYVTLRAEPYFAYFGKNAGPTGFGYYSYNLGAWHILSLNSNISVYPGSSQEQWLRADLARNKLTCILAYWHHPLFSSAIQPDRPRDVPALYSILYQYGAALVINGHLHLYERFAPQNPDGQIEPLRGIRQFIVGTGGASLSKKQFVPLPNSEALDNNTWGVIKLTLHPNSYDWQFIPVQGSTFTDAGSGRCVDRADHTF